MQISFQYTVAVTVATVLLFSKVGSRSCPTTECFCFEDEEIDCTQLDLRVVPYFDPDNNTFDLISLGQNRLKGIGQDAFNGIHVRKIKMMNNKRKGMFIHKDAFRGLEDDLMFLSFKKNKIPSLPVGLFRGFGKLKLIDLTACGIHSLAPENFKGATNATVLNMHDNYIERIPPRAFSGLRKLNELRLTNSGIKEVDGLAFRGLRELKKLFLQHNSIRDLQAKMFKKVSNLETLNLDDNEISALFPLMFKGLNRLESLSMANNPLELIADNTFKGMESLQELDISQCRLTYVKPGMFKGLKSLRKLLLTSNQIPDLPDKVFQYNPMLTAVSIDNNLLTSINPCAFDDVRNLKEINAWRNNVHCDCSLKWTSLSTTPNVRGRCASPDQEYDHDIDDHERYTVCTFSGMECGEEDVTEDMNTPLKFWLRYRRAYRRSPYLFYGKK